MVMFNTVGGEMVSFIAVTDNKRDSFMTFYFSEKEPFNLQSL